MNNQNYDPQAFLKLSPALNASVLGIPFYHHPLFGHEHPLMAIIDGKVLQTSFFNSPSVSEVVWLLNEIRPIPLPSFHQLKSFLIAHYKSEKLYGRNEQNGWSKDYGDTVVQSRLLDLVIHGNSLISRHETTSGEAVSFSSNSVISWSKKQ